MAIVALISAVILAICFLIDYSTKARDKKNEEVVETKDCQLVCNNGTIVDSKGKALRRLPIMQNLSSSEIQALCSKQRFGEHSYVAAIILKDKKARNHQIFLCTGE